MQVESGENEAARRFVSTAITRTGANIRRLWPGKDVRKKDEYLQTPRVISDNIERIPLISWLFSGQR
jgi:hypothetical protein